MALGGYAGMKASQPNGAGMFADAFVNAMQRRKAEKSQLAQLADGQAEPGQPGEPEQVEGVGTVNGPVSTMPNHLQQQRQMMMQRMGGRGFGLGSVR